MSDPPELRVLQELTDIFDKLGIAYAIGGSIASSIYGQVRFTQDADITVEPFDNQADKLFELLKPRYYISSEAMYQALSQRSTFNVIHLESAFKIDVFIRQETPFDKQLISRRKSLRLSDSIAKSFSVVSPEDIILLKLLWYRDSGCTSQVQWQDVLGVLVIQSDRLDFEYLRKWSRTLKISELLEKTISENNRS